MPEQLLKQRCAECQYCASCNGTLICEKTGHTCNQVLACPEGKPLLPNKKF